MVSIEGDWVREGMGRETGHTLRAGQGAHDFGGNGHYEDEAVRNDIPACVNALGKLLDTVVGYGLRIG